MRHSEQALKNEGGRNVDGTMAQALAATIRAVRLTMIKEQAAPLCDKEIACCMLATD